MSNTLEDFRRGDTLNLTLTFTDKVTGAAVDVTGMEFWLTLKSSPDDPDPGVMQVRYTAPAGADATAGAVKMTATSADTAITPGTYYYGIQRVIAGSPPDVQTTTPESARVRVGQDITRNTS